MLGVLVNVVSIFFGGVVGVVFKKFLSEKITQAVMVALGLATLVIGLKGALKTEKELLFVISLALGTAIGTIIDIDKHVHRFGEFIKKVFVKNANDSVLMNEFAAVGNLLVAVIGLNLIGTTKIKVANMLPSIVLVVILHKFVFFL